MTNSLNTQKALPTFARNSRVSHYGKLATVIMGNEPTEWTLSMPAETVSIRFDSGRYMDVYATELTEVVI